MALAGSVTVLTLCMVLFSVVWEVHTQYGAVAQVGINVDAPTNDDNTLEKVLYIRFPVRPIVKLKSKERIPPPKSEPTKPPKPRSKKALIPDGGTAQEEDRSIRINPGQSKKRQREKKRCPCEISSELPRSRWRRKEKRKRHRCPCEDHW
ncbi:hypothetical protein AVEN_41776-1 [Araneus ventricosus]|uniref:Uncharacterized protein n=1 Tax=Araneus ventricosus TaxID=182803 RepID=A0A4Y2ADN7_ARAVE|nr:hypothetical protein AVEN_41776-1 [Araneus ventricosus]